MSLDYYLSVGSLAAGIVTRNPVLLAVPTAFRLTANAYPKMFPLGMRKGRSIDDKEQKKLDDIKNVLNRVRQDVGIPDSVKINLRVSCQLGGNACMVGTQNSPGGPLLCLGDDWFKNYESLPSLDEGDFREWVEILHTGLSLDQLPLDRQLRARELWEKYKNLASVLNPDFREWLLTLHQMPNEPSAIGRFLDACSTVKRKRIEQLAGQFKHVLSENELESILAHELGHAKHHHLLKASGTLALVLVAERVVEQFAHRVGFGDVYRWAYLPLLFMTASGISREHEVEADGECAHTAKYRKGMVEFHKKEVIRDLFKTVGLEASFEMQAKQMLADSDVLSSHPNGAKRLVAALEMEGKKSHPPTGMTSTAWALAGLGLFILALDCHRHASNILG